MVLSKKTFIFLVIFAFLMIAEPSQAKVFNQENSMVENPADVPDVLAQYQIQDEAKGIFQKIAGEWKKINDWGTGLWMKNFDSWLGKYASQIKENVKQGWAEEKTEYRQDFFKTLGAAWEKIKNFVLHR